MKKLLTIVLAALITVNGILAVGMVHKINQLEQMEQEVEQLKEDLEWAELEAVEHWYE